LGAVWTILFEGEVLLRRDSRLLFLTCSSIRIF